MGSPKNPLVWLVLCVVVAPLAVCGDVGTCPPVLPPVGIEPVNVAFRDDTIAITLDGIGAMVALTLAHWLVSNSPS
jgi:hypothetical protein